MKKKYLIILILIMPFSAFCQNSKIQKYLSFDTSIFVNNEIIKTNLDIAYTSDSNEVYFIKKSNKIINDMKVGELDILNNKLKFKSINFNGYENYINRPNSPITCIDLFNNKLFLFYYNCVFVCVKSDESYTIIEKIDLPFSIPFNFASVLSDSKILFFTNYLGYHVDYDKSTSFILFDCKEKTVKEKHLEFKSPLYTYYGRKMCNFDGDKLYFSQSTEFNIKIYNKDLELIDSLVFNKKNWNTILEAKQKEIFYKNDQPVDRMSYFNSLFYKYPSICKTYSVNDYIIVSYLKPDNEGLRTMIDLFKKNNSKYELKIENDFDGIENIEGFNGYLLFNSDCLFVGEKLVQFRQGDTVDKNKFNKKDDYEKAIEDYYKKNDAILIIDIFNSNFK